MIISERERLELVRKLEEAMGHRAAATLMEYLPANGWREVATVTDLDNLRLELTAELEKVRGELAATRGELRGDLHAGLADIRAELAFRTAQQTRTMVVAFVGALVSFGGLLVAAAAIAKP